MQIVSEQPTGKKNYRILVVDDEEIIRFMLQTMLSDEGYDVLVAGDGTEATKLLGRESFNVAVIDRMLPDGESGIDIIRKLKKEQPFCEIILISGYPSFDSSTEAMGLEIFAYLAKPLKNAVIRDIIVQAINKSSMRKKRFRDDAIHASIFKTAPIPLAVYAPNGTALYANPAFVEMFGFERHTIADTGHGFVTPDDIDTTQAAFSTVLAGQQPVERTTKRTARNGTSYEVALSMFPVFDEILCISVTVFYKNIGSEKILKKLLAHNDKLSIRDQLIARISRHLLIIMEFTEIIRGMNESTERIKNDITIVSNAAKAIKTMLQELKDITHPPVPML